MRESSTAWSDEELIQRIRKNESLAFQELFWRFQTLLVRYARQLGVQPALREELVVELLNDAVLRLMQYDKRCRNPWLPISSRHFVTGWERQRAPHARQSRPRANSQAMATRAIWSSNRAPRHRSARVVVTGLSLRPWHPRSSDSRARLMRLTEEERAILDCVARYVPQRIIAEWVGMTHGALRIRVWRLRERLREAAVAYAAHLSPVERLELKDFFRRTAMLRREDVTRETTVHARHTHPRPVAPRNSPARASGDEN